MLHLFCAHWYFTAVANPGLSFGRGSRILEVYIFLVHTRLKERDGQTSTHNKTVDKTLIEKKNQQLHDAYRNYCCKRHL